MAVGARAGWGAAFATRVAVAAAAAVVAVAEEAAISEGCGRAEVDAAGDEQQRSRDRSARAASRRVHYA